MLQLRGARSAYGEIGQIQVVEEEKIETLCDRQKVKAVIEAIKKVHPYEEVDFDIIPLLGLDEL